MTWGRVAAYWALFGMALGYYLVSAPRERPAGEDAETRIALVSVRLDRVAEVAVERGEMRIRVGQEAGHWRMLAPAGVRVPADLISSFVVTQVEARAIERVGGDAAGPERFGLDPAATRVDLYERGHDTPVSVILGAENPTQTAIYAQVVGMPEVFLVGRVLQYYVDRIFEEVGRQRGA